MISAIDYPNRLGSDVDRYIIFLMKAVRDGWIPPTELSEEEYQNLKKGENWVSPQLVGFAGYGCSFGGKWFAGLARGGVTSKGETRNHVAESSRNLVAMMPKLQGLGLVISDYRSLELGEGNVIYCDIPYSTGTKYKSAFNVEAFWEWAREQSKVNYVYVSEYNAPDDFISVWEKEHKTGIDCGAKTHKPTIEKLFIWDDNDSLVKHATT